MRPLIEFLLVLFGPPVAQIPLSVELTPLIVKAVSQFMPDYGADPAKVHGIVGVVIVEGWLQDSGWEGNVVELRIVTGIHRHGRIRPVVFVDRFANLVQLALKLKLVRA